ncbi:protein SENESCENCE-ASSOCIATED GENE 21, mitochondrial-like [Triticum urartu]|uniref:Late embryogenesis abundant protein Lea5 n=2 Tax=Triticum urartu TaxID=4572 RepID=A0A8R7PVN2_TRIUA|nr:protein SENESCENCE-ASSOCIATED GENE 21, mitochondrial-like [Triticum urartu]
MERVASRCVSLLAQRRGYSAAATMVKGAGRSAAATEEKTAVAAKSAMAAKKDVGTGAEKAAWVPDPVTGYYRPSGGAKEVDAADLRAKLCC